jgi:predicted short-subunit dehydrogenase-like oxidoreductase (DUF2520 family)
MNFNLIGGGKLGKTIAHAFTVASVGTLQSVCNRSLESAQKTVDFLSAGQAVDNVSNLSEADITFITTPDDCISLVVESLVKTGVIKPGSFVVHCSGVLSSEILSPLKAQGAFIASIHPPKAFSGEKLMHDAFSDLTCVMEGDDLVLTWLEFTFQQLGATLVRIAPEYKALYHSACVFASNYLVTLALLTQELLLQAKVGSTSAKKITQNLMQGSLDNIATSDHPLTGPLSRADIGTLSLHLQALQNNPTTKDLYKLLATITLPWTSLTIDQKNTMLKLFSTQ